MARLVHGILGGLSGKVGDFDGYIRNGVAYVRKRRARSNRPPTEKQLVTRMRMSLAMNFLRTMLPYVRIGFSLAVKGQTKSAFDAAKSYLLLNAIAGEYPDLRIDYSKVRLTEGDMLAPSNVTATSSEDSVVFSWDVTLNLTGYERNAQAMMLVYVPKLNASFFKIGGACRYEGTDSLMLPEYARGLEKHVYFSFIGYDRMGVSDSLYVGVL